MVGLLGRGMGFRTVRPATRTDLIANRLPAQIRDRLCDELERYHQLAVAPTWPDMRLIGC